MDRPIISGERTIIAKEGTNLYLSCHAKGYPQVNYQWKFNGNIVRSNTSVTTIRNLRRQDAGNYTCVTTSEFKTMESGPVSVNVTCEYPIICQCHNLHGCLFVN